MKRILISLIFIISFIFASEAQTQYFRAINSRVCIEDDCTEWEESNVEIIWDFDKDRVYINSNRPQVIDYTYADKEKTSTEVHFYLHGIDRKGTKVRMMYSLYSDGSTFLFIEYPDVVVLYHIKEVANN